MEKDEFARMIEDIRLAKAAIGTPSYQRTKREEAGLFGRRSLYAVRDIKRGDAFTNENVRSIRPAYGLEPKYLEQLLGECAVRDIAFGSPIKIEDLRG